MTLMTRLAQLAQIAQLAQLAQIAQLAQLSQIAQVDQIAQIAQLADRSCLAIRRFSKNTVVDRTTLCTLFTKFKNKYLSYLNRFINRTAATMLKHWLKLCNEEINLGRL